MANRTNLRRLAALFLMSAGLSACENTGEPEVCSNALPPGTPALTTDFVTHSREWRPGEREAFIAAIQANGLSIPYVGDISNDAEQLFNASCATDIIPNPAINPAARSPNAPFGPHFAMRSSMVPGGGWASNAVDVHIVNAQQSNDTFDWQLIFWVNMGEPTWKGFVIAANANATMAARTINTTNFDNANAKTGAAAGEARQSNGTFWQGNGTGTPNQFSISASGTTSGPTTFPSGPFQGGTRQDLSMTANVNNVGLTRVLGSGTPINQTAAVSGNFTGGFYNCLFPTPCTTNVPNLAAAARAGTLTDAQYAQLPWIASMPAPARAAAIRARASQR